MSIFKNINVWLLLATIIGAFFLRLIFLDKPQGLWNDEYVSWSIAVVPLGKSFFNAILAQCHMPIYYLYLKFLTHFFGDSDLFLRFTSLIPSLISIILMFFIGKLYKDEKLGLLCAFFCATSSFLIYFSQEVRFYSLLFMFSALVLYSVLKLLKEQNFKNTAIYLISNLLIVFTHTIGILFVFFNFIFVSSVLYKVESSKIKIRNIWVSFLIFSVFALPFIVNILTQKTFSQWWGQFNFSKIGYLITDYFSPVLTNIVNAPDTFFHNMTIGFFTFAIVPSVIALIGIFRSLVSRENVALPLFWTCFAYTLTLIIFSLSGKLVFLTKYTVEIYPILILLVCFGWLEFNKVISRILVIVFSFLSLFYLLFMPNSAPKMQRPEGHKQVADLLRSAHLKHNDYILLNYYPKDRFEKYADFSPFNVVSINKGNFPEFLGEKDFTQIISNGKVVYRDVFELKDKTVFYHQLDSKIVSNMKKGQKVAVVILNSISLYSPSKISFIVGNEQNYKKVPFLFLVFSHIKNEELNYFFKTLKRGRAEQMGSWTVVTFEKE